MTYTDKLTEIGIRLLEPLKQVKTHHQMQCILCGHEWSATPLSKIQNFKKHGIKGCPKCSSAFKYDHARQLNIQKIKDRGLEILSDWDGTTSTGKECIPIDVTVRNIKCGHTFTSSSTNLLNREIECTVCGVMYRTNYINAWSELNSTKWRQTASEWQKYKSDVTKLTRINYKASKQLINPDNLPTGRAGTEGAYHLDHIVPIRYCFNHSIPVEICADPSNLQMLGWLENVGSRDKLKKDTNVPDIMHKYINDQEKENVVV